MAGWDTPALLTKLVELLGTVTGVTDAQVGVPNSIAGLFGTYVSAADQDFGQVATSLLRRETAAFVWFAYRTSGNVNDAELAVANALDDFARKFFADRTLGGTLEDGRLDYRLAGTQEYLTIAGREFRQYPIRVVGRQTEVVG